MSKLLLFFSAMLIILATACNSNESDFKNIKITYHQTPKDLSVVDTFWGTPIADPYRWLENGTSPTTRDWLAQQKQTAEDYLKRIPFREDIKNRLHVLWNHERCSSPRRAGNYFYALKNNGLQNQDILYRLGNERDTVILDPNQFSVNGTRILEDFNFSKDGSLLAYEVSQGGSDWRMVLLWDLEFKRPLLDTLRGIKFSNIAWFQDGFFYSRYPTPEQGKALTGINTFQQVFYHRVGTPQSEDELVFADRSHPYRNFSAQTTADERFLILAAEESLNSNALYFRDLTSNDLAFNPIIDNFSAAFQVVGNIGNYLLVLTNYKAPKYRLVQINTARPEERYWQEIIAESNDVLQNAYLFGGKLVTTYIRDASNRVRIFDLNGNMQQEIQLPEIGSVQDWQGKSDESRAFFTFSSFTRPPVVFELNLNDYTTRIFHESKVAFDGKTYETRQVRYKSKDGTEIPMFLVFKKGLTLDRNRPTLLIANGGFGESMIPNFNLTNLYLFPIVLENGGICAVANIRGGGELGETWHQAAIKTNKNKSFEDFQAAAEYLIANNYTSSEKLAIYGHSNGGLAVGAAMTQRPDLFAVAIPDRSLSDLFRYHQFTIGWIWKNEFGTVHNQQEFEALQSYSPLHNAVPASYPATFITSANNDDYVVPAHSYKFVAKLQANQQNEKPILIRTDNNMGHSAKKQTIKKLEEASDILAFMFYNLKESVIY
ncbi:MAG: prolyl oligopeptidase family serine peptidase [Saprospiraceae bacterium]|nr:prolyl oligopeptidase family serine peptidase [Saprospiraceae bacterium]